MTSLTTSETIREEALNTILAAMLVNGGLSAHAERRSREGVPDVRLSLRSGDLVLLECKWEGSLGLLETQLDERLEQFSEALGALGVLYPRRLRIAEDTAAGLTTATDLRWWLHGCRGVRFADRRIHSALSPTWLTKSVPCHWSWRALTGLQQRLEYCGTETKSLWRQN